jgi:hypothetical protein
MSEAVTTTSTSIPMSTPPANAPVETPPAGTPGTQAGTPAGETLILGKFKSQDDLIKSYQELEKKLGQRTPPANTESQPPADPLKIDNAPPSEPTKPEPISFDKYAEHYTTNGNLADEHFAELEAKGIPRNVVDTYLNGLKAQSQLTAQTVYSMVGGQEQYTAMTAWAKANLSAEEVNAYNNAVSNGDDGQRKMAIAGLQARYNGTREGDLLSGKGTTHSVAGFASWGDVQTAMRDKRYGKDASYTAEVQSRLAASPNL